MVLNRSGNKQKRTRKHGDEDDDDDNYDDHDEDPDSENDDDSDTNSVVVTSDTPLTKRKKSVPNKREARWNEMFYRLIEYKKQFKHTCVPKGYKADLVLARWVKKQRINYRHK